MSLGTRTGTSPLHCPFPPSRTDQDEVSLASDKQRQNCVREGALGNQLLLVPLVYPHLEAGGGGREEGEGGGRGREGERDGGRERGREVGRGEGRER